LMTNQVCRSMVHLFPYGAAHGMNVVNELRL
jgi:hypothetical protein